MSFSISITHSTQRTRSVARMSFAAETVGPKKDSTGARPPNSVDITGTPPIKGITVTDAVAVSVTRLPSAQWRRLNFDLVRYHRSIGGPKQKSLLMSGNRRRRHRPSSFRFYLSQVATSAPIGTRDGEPPSIAIFGYPQ